MKVTMQIRIIEQTMSKQHKYQPQTRERQKLLVPKRINSTKEHSQKQKQTKTAKTGELFLLKTNSKNIQKRRENSNTRKILLPAKNALTTNLEIRQERQNEQTT